MTQEQAIKILVQTAEGACKAGLFTLPVAKIVAEAVEMLKVEEPNVEEPAKEEVK